MKSTDKKDIVNKPIDNPKDKEANKKQSSGDKLFDDAIDRLFKPMVIMPSK